MRQEEREMLRRRFDFRCGYSSVSELHAGSELTVDHFQPRSRGGLHAPENWVYCCHACNEFKGDLWQPDSISRILHPLKDDLTAHVAEQADGKLGGLSETGVFHIARLNLNRPQLVAYRAERQLFQAACRQQDELLKRLRELEADVRSLTSKLENLGRGGA